MGFAIGGSRTMRELVRGGLRRAHPPECAVAAEFTRLWGWDVVPGARAAGGSCSCGRRGCPTPGAHPLDLDARLPAGTGPDEVARAWAEVPGASVMLPVGRAFDILEVSAVVGARALARLERMGLPSGPVMVTPRGRALFLVAPGAAKELPRLLYRTGWDHPLALDLKCLGPGAFVTAPPCDHGGEGPVRWLRRPPLDAPVDPPEARLLVGTLAHLAHRSRRCRDG
ncbi:bifunctional DNA primase/polymerase [Streptomyces sp. WMMC905]|uniref:bifunctional DNA primase/polymerase n=1 Tax=Streptomyces sp. WMMC905 TaxID=3404123 RepID=UPI003B95C0CC